MKALCLHMFIQKAVEVVSLYVINSCYLSSKNNKLCITQVWFLNN